MIGLRNSQFVLIVTILWYSSLSFSMDTGFNAIACRSALGIQNMRTAYIERLSDHLLLFEVYKSLAETSAFPAYLMTSNKKLDATFLAIYVETGFDLKKSFSENPDMALASLEFVSKKLTRGYNRFVSEMGQTTSARKRLKEKKAEFWREVRNIVKPEALELASDMQNQANSKIMEGKEGHIKHVLVSKKVVINEIVSAISSGGGKADYWTKYLGLERNWYESFKPKNIATWFHKKVTTMLNAGKLPVDAWLSYQDQLVDGGFVKSKTPDFIKLQNAFDREMNGKEVADLAKTKKNPKLAENINYEAYGISLNVYSKKRTRTEKKQAANSIEETRQLIYINQVEQFVKMFSRHIESFEILKMYISREKLSAPELIDMINTSGNNVELLKKLEARKKSIYAQLRKTKLTVENINAYRKIEKESSDKADELISRFYYDHHHEMHLMITPESVKKQIDLDLREGKKAALFWIQKFDSELLNIDTYKKVRKHIFEIIENNGFTRNEWKQYLVEKNKDFEEISGERTRYRSVSKNTVMASENITESPIRFYRTSTGHDVVSAWLDSLEPNISSLLRDRIVKALHMGLGDVKSVNSKVGSKIWEIRIFTGPSYRIYYSKINGEYIIWAGGDKGSQTRDINIATDRYNEYVRQ